ncbi:MAG: HupE/UreJ family protein [Oceanospirillales bacterium]|nr:HupE/UreJ family protein [Oceanospirillales bacterium]
MRTSFVVAVTAVALLPGTALAHTGHEVSGFVSGLAHPVGGADHLLAMLAVGLWAARLGGRALWLVPLTFVATMVLGNALALSGVSLALTEQGIGVSVVVLGLLLACAARFATPVCMAIAGGFALFHGLAHGAEMPLTATGFTYAAGFTLATLGLHLLGMLLGKVGDEARARLFSRVTGGAIALTGVALLAA